MNCEYAAGLKKSSFWFFSFLRLSLTFPGKKTYKSQEVWEKKGRDSEGLPDTWRGVSKISLDHHAFLTRPPMERLKSAGYYAVKSALDLQLLQVFVAVNISGSA